MEIKVPLSDHEYKLNDRPAGCARIWTRNLAEKKVTWLAKLVCLTQSVPGSWCSLLLITAVLVDKQDDEIPLQLQPWQETTIKGKYI